MWRLQEEVFSRWCIFSFLLVVHGARLAFWGTLAFGVHGLVCSRLDLLWFPSLPAMIRAVRGLSAASRSFFLSFVIGLALLCTPPIFIPFPLFDLRSSPENFVLIDIWLFSCVSFVSWRQSGLVLGTWVHSRELGHQWTLCESDRDRFGRCFVYYDDGVPWRIRKFLAHQIYSSPCIIRYLFYVAFIFDAVISLPRIQNATVGESRATTSVSAVKRCRETVLGKDRFSIFDSLKDNPSLV